jgi:hypothetical protein
MKDSGSLSKLTATPSSPPVQARGFLSTRIEPASANARVTIANAIPPTRRLTEPRITGSTIATAAVKASAAGRLQSHFVVAIAVR